jgi:hypothetical protein
VPLRQQGVTKAIYLEEDIKNISIKTHHMEAVPENTVKIFLIRAVDMVVVLLLKRMEDKDMEHHNNHRVIFNHRMVVNGDIIKDRRLQASIHHSNHLMEEVGVGILDRVMVVGIRSGSHDYRVVSMVFFAWSGWGLCVVRGSGWNGMDGGRFARHER